ncbi:MAG TPA: hypothetical protein VGW33_01455 [Terriglobia bacterium]|nr:hypothetical protein [Terriglobia bacterium]
MVNDLHNLRETLRQRLVEEFQSHAMAEWVLTLVMPEVRKTIRGEREMLARLAEELGCDELATAVRSGKAVVAHEPDKWTRRLPFAEA